MRPVSSANGMKFARLDAAKARMLPAKNRVEAGDGAVFKPHHGLEEEFDFVAFQRSAQFAFQRLAVGALRAHGRPKNLDAAAAVALGVAHGDLGVLEHVIALGMPLRIEQGDADRDAQGDFAIGEGHRGRKRAPDLVSERDDFFAAVFRDQNYREKIGGNARQSIARLQNAAEPTRHGQKDRVLRPKRPPFH